MKMLRGPEYFNKIITKMKKNKLDPVFLVIILCGLLLRLHNLGKYSFWYDEAASLLWGPEYLWEGLKNFLSKGTTLSISNILFPCFLLHFWKYLGKSEFVLRLLPMAFGIFSIIGIYMVAKLLFNKRIAHISTFILSISPLHVYYSQELKYNTLIIFLSLLSIYFYIKSVKENRPITWLALIVFIILAVYTHIVALFLLIALNVHYFSFFNKYRKLISKWLVTQVTILFFLIPWIILIFKQLLEPDSFSAVAFISRPSLLRLFYSFQIFNIGYGAPLFICLLAVFLGLWLFVIGILSIKTEKEKASLLLVWFLTPVILIYIISFMMKPIYLHRTLIYVTPAYYIILACGFVKIKKKIVWILLVLFILLSFVSLRNQYKNVLPLSSIPYHPGVFVKVENKLAANYIEKNFQKGDIIGHLSFYTLLPFIYYHSGKFQEKCVSEIDDYNFRFYHLHSNPAFQNQFSFVDIKQFVKGNKRIWLVISSFGASNSPLQLHPERLVKAKKWLDKNCNLVDSKLFWGIMINLYQIKPE